MKNLKWNQEQLCVYLNDELISAEYKLKEAQTGVSELESGNIQYSTFAVSFNPDIEYWKQQVELYKFRLGWLNVQLSSNQVTLK